MDRIDTISCYDTINYSSSGYWGRGKLIEEIEYHAGRVFLILNISNILEKQGLLSRLLNCFCDLIELFKQGEKNSIETIVLFLFILGYFRCAKLREKGIKENVMTDLNVDRICISTFENGFTLTSSDGENIAIDNKEFSYDELIEYYKSYIGYEGD